MSRGTETKLNESAVEQAVQILVPSPNRDRPKGEKDKMNALRGTLTLPQDSSSLVLFVTTPGSRETASRPMRSIATHLSSEESIGTLDVEFEMSKDESERAQTSASAQTHLQRQVAAVLSWIQKERSTARFLVGVMAEGVASAAVIRAAVQRPDQVKAVVVLGGRPDLAAEELGRLEAPCMLIAAGHDTERVDIARGAFNSLTKCERDFEVIPGAGALLEEEGALENATRAASYWFGTYLKQTGLAEGQPSRGQQGQELHNPKNSEAPRQSGAGSKGGQGAKQSV